MSKTIMVDVDNVLADSCLSWSKWLCSVTGASFRKEFTWYKCLNYDLTEYFKEELHKEGLTGMEYWHSPNLYDNVGVVKGSVEGCTTLSNLGYRLLPVSKVYYSHSGSKAKFLKEHFPMLEEPIFLGMGGDKSDIKCDYVIEDRVDHLKGFTPPVKCIILNTPYLQEEEELGSGIRYSLKESWEEIVEGFKEEALSYE